MEHTRTGGLRVTYEQALFDRRRSGSTLPGYLDVIREAVDAAPARPLPPKSAASRRRTYADGELDVFAAERYFKGAMDGDHKEEVADAAVPVETTAAAARPAVVVSKPAWTCASAASAASGASAHSQTALLRNASHRRGKKSCLQVGVLLRACSGKRAVRVDGGAQPESTGSGAAAAVSRIEWYRDLRMEKAGLGLAGDGNHRGVVAGLPPNLNLGAAKVAAIGRDEKGEYRSASFTLHAPVKASVPANGDAGRGCADEDDGGSESSSDLFEIKSLMIDDSPYEPSEASIQWSVVTASAAGDVSVAGNGGGRAPAAMRQHLDRPAGLLSGCVSHRAVDVSATTAVRRLPPRPAR